MANSATVDIPAADAGSSEKEMTISTTDSKLIIANIFNNTIPDESIKNHITRYE